MAKVSADQSAANRQALVKAAGKLFRQKGIASVGVAELCAAAGLTHGALYSHFESKEALAAEAFAHGQAEIRKRMSHALGEKAEPDAVINYYVSDVHRDSISACCPMLASASDAARQSPQLKQEFAHAFEDLAQALEKVGQGNQTNEADIRLVVAASMVGVVSAARALKSTNPALSDKLLESSRKVFNDLVSLKRASPSAKKDTHRKS